MVGRQCYLFLFWCLSWPIQFDSQGSDNEFVQGDAAIQCRLASPVQEGFIEGDGGAHAILMITVFIMMSKRSRSFRCRQGYGGQAQLRNGSHILAT